MDKMFHLISKEFWDIYLAIISDRVAKAKQMETMKVKELARGMHTQASRAMVTVDWYSRRGSAAT